jgi:hypothetical protein
MDPRLRPAVELPVRRIRPAVSAVVIVFLFGIGAQSYFASMRRGACARRPMMKLELISDPPGATVVRVGDGRTMCVAPCAVGIQAEPGVTSFRFELPDFQERIVPVNLSGGDTRVEAVLRPYSY